MDMKLYTMKRKWWNVLLYYMTSYDCFYSICDIYTTQP